MSLDSSLDAYSSVDAIGSVETALAQWQYELAQNHVGVKFVLDLTPHGFEYVMAAALVARGGGTNSYYWHISDAPSIMYTDDMSTAYAATTEFLGDGSGRSRFMETRLLGKNWPSDMPGKLSGLIAHEAGHALGLADDRYVTPFSIMSNETGDEDATQPTCSDARAVLRAASQDTNTGYTVYDDHL